MTIFPREFILLGVSKEVELLSVAEAAEKLGVTRARVNQLISGLRLPAKRIGRSFVIREPDLKLVANRKPGRPSAKKVVSLSATNSSK